MSPVRLRVYADTLDIPACGCPTHFRLLCQHQGEEGCPCASGRECDCPRFPGRPCRHILSRRHRVSLEDWAALLRLVDPLEYPGDNEPPPPHAPALVLSEEKRVAVMAERYNTCVCGRCVRDPLHPDRWKERGCNGLALSHPGDAWRQEDDLRVGIVSLREYEDADGVRRCRVARLRTGRVSLEQAVVVDVHEVVPRDAGRDGAAA